MELFINMAFIVIILALVITFLRSPLEILRNLLKGTVGLIVRGSLGPFGFLAGDAIRQWKAEKRRSKHIKRSLAEPNQSTYIHLPFFEVYLIVQRASIGESMKIDLEAFNLTQTKPFSFIFHEHSESTIVKIEGLLTLESFAFLIRHTSNLFGIDHTFGFIRNDEFSVLFMSAYDDPGCVIGRTDENRTFYFSLLHKAITHNHIIYQDQPGLNPKYTVTLFEAIIQTTKAQTELS